MLEQQTTVHFFDKGVKAELLHRKVYCTVPIAQSIPIPIPSVHWLCSTIPKVGLQDKCNSRICHLLITKCHRAGTSSCLGLTVGAESGAGIVLDVTYVV